MSIYEITVYDLVDELSALNDLVDDEDISEAIQIILNLISKPDVPPAAARTLVVKLQALSSKFSMMAFFYRTLGYDKTKESKFKKDAYYSMRDTLEKLADAMKYLARI